MKKNKQASKEKSANKEKTIEDVVKEGVKKAEYVSKNFAKFDPNKPMPFFNI